MEAPGSPAPTDLTLRAGAVHLWVMALDGTPEGLSPDCLDSWERERSHRLLPGTIRARYIAAHMRVRQILGQYLGVAPAAVSLARADNGKPFVAGASLEFSLSHSGRLAVCAVGAGGPLGVDIECLRPVADANGIVRQMFDAGEVAEYEAHRGHARVEAFFSAWTRKEAFLKATGEGLLRPLDSFQVRVSPTRPPALLRVDGDEGAPARWSMHAFSPAPGFAGALAFEGVLTSVEMFGGATGWSPAAESVAAAAVRSTARS